MTTPDENPAQEPLHLSKEPKSAAQIYLEGGDDLPPGSEAAFNPDRYAWAKRLGACLFGGLILALMVGKQEGTINGDFGIAFREAVLRPRVFIFLGIGVVIFLLITFWPIAARYIKRPGVKPYGAGLLTLVVALTVMDWYDPLAENGSATARFKDLRGVVVKTSSLTPLNDWFDIGLLGWILLAVAVLAVIAALLTRHRMASYLAGVLGIAALVTIFLDVRSAVDDSHNLISLAKWFFVDYLAWILPGIALVVGAAAIVTRSRVFAYLTAVVGVVGAAAVYFVHNSVEKVGGQPDHALGWYLYLVGFLVVAGAGLTAYHASSDVAQTRAFAERMLNWRPGVPMVVLGLIFGLIAFFNDCWYGPVSTDRNNDFSGTGKLFKDHGLSSLASTYFSWFGLTAFIVATVLAVVASYFFNRIAAGLAILVSVAGVVATFFTLKSVTFRGFILDPASGQRWGNLGVGGFTACIVFALYAAAALQVLLGGSVESIAARDRDAEDKQLPVTAMVNKIRRSARAKAIIVVILAVALFYPPMLTVTWQNVLVTQIGAYVFLAVGLNVVVGWAGLLDLGYIAFYGIGSYTTAYVTGSLPVKPPSWLHVTPLLAIPFAILACLIAGVLLGAPTLRLRGDYLAIVTLGFGEITVVVATLATGLTGGSIGPTVPHPKIHIGGLHVTFGEDNLPYWYLLLVLLVIVLVLFYRLEGSRLGRAWAAIREDEVAAQASGVNTMRVKLLAFAIGASTSGLAGVFFATQIGYFDPTLFTLQESILIVAYVVFGGMGSLPGAMAGAFVLTWVPQFLKSQVPSDDRQMWVGALVLAMMIFRPAGLLPAKRRKAELEGLEGSLSSEVQAVPASEGL